VICDDPTYVIHIIKAVTPRCEKGGFEEVQVGVIFILALKHH
jgi:hypothetical protein